MPTTLLKLILAIVLSLNCLQSWGQEQKSTFAKWEKAIAAYEKADATRPPPQGGILFVGSSTIRKWVTLEQDFPGLPVFNRGFGGSQIADSTHFASRIIIPYAPRMVVFHAGDNDLASGKTAEAVFADLKELIATIHAKLPETTFCYISIKPTEKREKLRAAQKVFNQSVQDLAKVDPRVRYIDSYDLVADAEGNPRPELFEADRLHFNAAGYKLLTAQILPFLKQ